MGGTSPREVAEALGIRVRAIVSEVDTAVFYDENTVIYVWHDDPTVRGRRIRDGIMLALCKRAGATFLSQPEAAASATLSA